MKSRFINYTIFAFLIYCCTACSENKPIIPCLSCEGNVTPPNQGTIVKKVLMEEFTGVRCVNCPQAKTEIENLQSPGLFGENFIAVSYHAGFFSRPYTTGDHINKNDYRTEQGDGIIEFLDQPIGFPSGVINRKQFSGEDDLQIESFATWGGFIGQELEEEAIISLALETTYNRTNKLLNVSVVITPIQNIEDGLSLSLLITENDIIDVQLTPDGLVNEYAQTQVFRTMITTTFGNPINDALVANQPISSIFSYTIASEWVAENCKVVAFVHNTTKNKEVLQVEEVSLVK